MNEDQNNSTVDESGEVPKSQTSSNILPKSKILPKLFNGLKKSGKGLVNGVKNSANFIRKAATFIIKFKVPILIGIVAMLLFVVIAIAIDFFNLDNIKGQIDSSTTKVFDSWGDNLTEEQERAKKSYEKTGSVMDFNINDVSSMTDDFNETVSKLEPSNKLWLLYSNLVVKKGSFWSAFGSDTISPENLRYLYEHILLISKYDFNNVKWDWYSHSSTDGSGAMPMVNDKKIGVKYPDDSAVNSEGATKYETFSDLLKPYLMSYEIPMSFYSGIISKKDYDQDVAVNFTYALVKHSLSDITVDRYDVQKYNLNTFFRIYDYNNCNSAFTAYVSANEDGTFNVSYGGVEEIVNPQVNSKNTSLNAEGQYDPMMETVIPDKTYTSTSVKYYISKALMYDYKYEQSYNYRPYSDSDASNRTGEDGHYENVDAIPEGEIFDPNNAKVSAIQGAIGQANSLQDIVSAIESSNNVYGIISEDGNSIRFVSRNTYEKVISGTTTYVERVWEDSLSSSGSAKQDFYTVDDVIEYNKKASGDSFSEDDFKASSSYEYYQNLESAKMLDRVIMMNSNPSYINEYLSDSQKYNHMKYVGISNPYFYELCYPNLKSYFNDLLTKNDNSFPYVYGRTLGFGRSVGGTNEYQSASGMSILKRYIHSHENSNGAPMYDENKNKTTDESKAKYYLVEDARDNVHTVGYGVNMEANRDRLEKYGINVSAVNYGDFIDKEIVDKVEDEIINQRLEMVKSVTSGLDLKEYQIHALVSHSYLAYSVSSFVSPYQQYWHPDTDDLYDQLSKDYKDRKDDVTGIMSHINFNHPLYDSFFGNYNGSVDGNGAYKGWIYREKSEFTLFQGGYYSTLKLFWSDAGAGVPGDIQLVDGDTIIPEGLLSLQTWYEDNIFSGRLRADQDIYSADWRYVATNSKNHDGYGVINPEFESLIAAKVNYFQCPWWSSFRGNIYLNQMGSDRRLTTFAMGDKEAKCAADELGLSLNYSIDGIRPYSIISFGKSDPGHTAFVEAVTNDSIIISHCGSGKYWHGVNVLKKSDMESGTYLFNNSVCLTDALN